MQNVTTEELIRQYKATLKAYQVPVKLIQSGQALDVGGVVIPKGGAQAGRISVRRR